MRNRYTTEERQNFVLQFKKGNQTATEFAASNGINPVTFKSWLYTKDRKVTDTKTAAGFVEVKAQKNWKPEVIRIRKSGIEIEVPVMADKKCPQRNLFSRGIIMKIK